jgi:hypothetical protein
LCSPCGCYIQTETLSSAQAVPQAVRDLILAQAGRLVSLLSGFSVPSGAQSAQSRQPRPIVGRSDARRMDVRQLSPGAFRRRPENIPL